MHKINWDDFRVVLAVCDAGSVNGAAKQLGLNHATILRRVANFEERHGVSIFIKSGKGYKLNQSSAQILNSLRSLDSAVVELERRLQGHESAISGVVRITSTDSFTDRILPELVVDLCKNQQGLLVNLMTTNNALDLDKTEADIAVRAGFEPPDGLISQEICRLGIVIYRRQTRPTRAHGGPTDRQNWVRRTGLNAQSPIYQWQDQSIAGDTVVAQADTFSSVARFVTMGVGAGMIPCVLGDAIAGLERISGMPDNIRPGVWLVCHSDMIDLPHIRTTYDFLVENLRVRRAELIGDAV